MPFLAPVAGPLIGAAGSLIGGLLGKKAAQPNSQESALSDQLLKTSQDAAQRGGTLLDTSTGALNPALNYWTNILSGNRNAATYAMQPEINTANQQFANARNQVSTYAPMGGGRSAIMAQLPFQQSSLISNIITQARPQAAQNLAQTGLGIGNLGSQLYGTASNAGNSLLNYGLAQRQQAYNFGSGTAQGVGNLLNSIPWGTIFKRSGSSDGGTLDGGMP